MDYNTLISTSTALMNGLASSLFSGTFELIKAVMPYIAGLVILSVVISLAFRLIKKIS